MGFYSSSVVDVCENASQPVASSPNFGGAKKKQHSNFLGIFSQLQEDVTLQGDVATQEDVTLQGSSNFASIRWYNIEATTGRCHNVAAASRESDISRRCYNVEAISKETYPSRRCYNIEGITA